MDLEEATTAEIFDELIKRNHTVVLLVARILDQSRLDFFANSSGSFRLIFGMMEQEMLRSREASLILQREELSDDSLSDSDDEEPE